MTISHVNGVHIMSPQPTVSHNSLQSLIGAAEALGRSAAGAHGRTVDCPYRDDGMSEESNEWLLRQAWHRGYREICEQARRDHAYGR